MFCSATAYLLIVVSSRKDLSYPHVYATKRSEADRKNNRSYPAYFREALRSGNSVSENSIHWKLNFRELPFLGNP